MAAKVLLVEDDNNLREIYQARLSAEGYDIVAAQDGEEALVSAKKEHPDLIISDVMMPRISGFEMLDILRNTDELKNTKVIMLTALGQAEDQKRADNLGADKYLVKSQVTLEDIVTCAQELLKEAGVVQSDSSSVETTVAAPSAPEPAAETASAPTPEVMEPVQAPTPTISTPVPDPMPTPLPQPAPPITLPAVPEPPVPVSPVEPPTPLISEPVLQVTPEPIPAELAIETPATVPPSIPVAPMVPETPIAVALPAPLVVDTTPITVPDLTTSVPAEDVTAVPTDTVENTVPIAPVVLPIEPVSAVVTAPVSEVALPASDLPLNDSPVPVSAPVSTPESAVTDSSPQTLEEEEAAIAKQIDSYASTPAEPVPVAPAQTSEEAANEASDDALMAGAVEQLEASVEPEKQPVVASPVVAEPIATVPEPPVATVPSPVEPPVEAAPEVPTEPMKTTSAPTSSASENVSVAGKKVIKPLNDSVATPDLNELLAKEAAKQDPAPLTPIVNGQPAAQKPFDPNAISL